MENKKFKKVSEKFAIEVFKNYKDLSDKQIRKICNCLNEIDLKDFADVINSLKNRSNYTIKPNNDYFNIVDTTNNNRYLYLRFLYNSCHNNKYYDIKNTYDARELVEEFRYFTLKPINNKFPNESDIIEYKFNRLISSKKSLLYHCEVIKNNSEVIKEFDFCNNDEVISFIHDDILINTPNFCASCEIMFDNYYYFTSNCRFFYENIDDLINRRKHITTKDLINYTNFSFNTFNTNYQYNKLSDNKYEKIYLDEDTDEDVNQIFTNDEMINDVKTFINENGEIFDLLVYNDKYYKHLFLEE